MCFGTMVGTFCAQSGVDETVSEVAREKEDVSRPTKVGVDLLSASPFQLNRRLQWLFSRGYPQVTSECRGKGFIAIHIFLFFWSFP